MTPILLDDYRLPPGVCYLCKAARRYPGEIIVDTGLMVDTSSGITGRPDSPNFAVGYVEEPLVICGSCVTELGGAAGLIEAVKAQALDAIAHEALARLDQVTAERDDLRTALAALNRAGGWQGSPTITGGGLVPPIPSAVVGHVDVAPQLLTVDAPVIADPLECCGRVFATPSALRLHRDRSAAHKETQ